MKNPIEYLYEKILLARKQTKKLKRVGSYYHIQYSDSAEHRYSLAIRNWMI